MEEEKGEEGEEKGEEGEEREEREEKEGAEEERSRDDINKGVKNNGVGWREEHEENEIGTYHESGNPADIETNTTESVVGAVRGVQNAEVEPERENAAESLELREGNSLCTGDVQVHR